MLLFFIVFHQYVPSLQRYPVIKIRHIENIMAYPTPEIGTDIKVPNIELVVPGQNHPWNSVSNELFVLVGLGSFGNIKNFSICTPQHPVSRFSKSSMFPYIKPSYRFT